MTKKNHQIIKGMISHFDRGAQYASNDFVEIVKLVVIQLLEILILTNFGHKNTPQHKALQHRGGRGIAT